MEILTYAELFLEFIAELGIFFLECTGIVVLMVSSIKAVYALIRHNADVRLNLAQGIALALTFKLGGEVLRTVIVREWKEMLMLGAIIVLRGALTLLIHWEIKTEEKHAAEHTEAAAN